MTAINNIVPGKTVNNGIRDMSYEELPAAVPTYPIHMPVLHVVTPKGLTAKEAGTQWIPLASFNSIFGDITDPTTPYYNPISVAIKMLGAGGQSTIGVRRLSANESKSRVALSAFIQRVEVPEYERDALGNYRRDGSGERIPTGEIFNGLKVTIKKDPEAKNKEPGGLESRTIAAIPGDGGDPGTPETMILPLFEAIAGVGDEYNQSFLQIGTQKDPLTMRAVSEFLTETGVFPLQLRTFTENKNGSRRYSKTVNGTEQVDITLFETRFNNQKFSIKNAFGSYNNTNLNKKSIPRPSAFNDTYIYEDNIDTLCQLMYVVESEHNINLLDGVDLPHRQMNPFGLFDHTGSPYQAIITEDVNVWDLIGAVQSEHGVSPFLLADGSIPSYVERPQINDPFGLLVNVERPLSLDEGWQITNALLLEDLQLYIDSAEPKNYSKNVQSFIWDVGFEQEVKDMFIEFLGVRKDIFVKACGTVWKPGQPNTIDEVYSRSTMLATRARMYPESEKWGTATCRLNINRIQARVIDEETGYYFSGNLDLMVEWAECAGNGQGIFIASRSPDTRDNRNLKHMHSPLVEFEDDFVAAENFRNGIVTLRSRDTERSFRPALPTVYGVEDSVLKDEVTVVCCIALQKIAQDEWNALTGSTGISSEGYQSGFKDAVERKGRDNLGGIVKGITVEPSYAENVKGGKATMKAIIHAYFNKAKYMLELDLYAHNADDLGNS